MEKQKRWYSGIEAKRIGWHDEKSWIPDPAFATKSDPCECGMCHAWDNYHKPHIPQTGNYPQTGKCVKCGGGI
jgi:hypothetical protein